MRVGKVGRRGWEVDEAGWRRGGLQRRLRLAEGESEGEGMTFGS